MSEVHFFENAIVAITTSALDDPVLFTRLCEDVKVLFEVDDVLVTYLAADGNEKKILLSQCTATSLLLASTVKTVTGLKGDLALSSLDSDTFILRYSWAKFKKNKYAGKSCRHNEISLHFDVSRFSSKDKGNQLIYFSKNLASKFEADYLKVYNIKNDKCGRTGKHDLSNGIHDIYWLNIFGRPFVDMIGRQKLLTSPAWNVQEIDEERVYVQACNIFCDHSQSDNASILNKIREHVGEQYFYKIKSVDEDKSGVFTFFDFLKAMWKAARNEDNPKAKADVCPNYDYTKMLF